MDQGPRDFKEYVFLMHSAVGLEYIWTSSAKLRESTRQGQLKQYLLGLQSIVVCGPSMPLIEEDHYNKSSELAKDGFPFLKRKMVEQCQCLTDKSTDILFQQASFVKLIPYQKLYDRNYTKVHHDKMSYAILVVLRLTVSKT